MKTYDIRFAMLGCGAVTEMAHLPAINRISGGAAATLLIDSNLERRNRLAAKFGIGRTAGDVEGCFGLFDAAIVALPHALHASAATRLLERGKSVLVEKPMALTAAECDQVIDAAKRSGATLAVGLMRRFLPSLQFARALIKGCFLGRIESFDFREGGVYSWPVASDFFFRKEAAGGGVLIDTGAHTLDCLLYLLGEVSAVEYFDDAEGGVDANCLIKLKYQDRAQGVVELSRTRSLRNTGIIQGERGIVEIGLTSNTLKIIPSQQGLVLEGSAAVNTREPSRTLGYLDLITMQLEDFISAIREHRSPITDGESAKRSVKLMEACYCIRQPLRLPWLDYHRG
jgi:predicted dehydrogenase